jgi:hypothetical protein
MYLALGFTQPLTETGIRSKKVMFLGSRPVTGIVLLLSEITSAVNGEL